ncbi:MAG: cation acetate symporter [Proteobacteria bacterium]|nr:cation acetate symporter [Pseudomonadota bacterium]
MGIQGWTYIMVGLTFGIYLTIAWMARVKDAKGFYVAGGGVSPLANGLATAADWMSAASFLGMAGIIAFQGYSGSVYLMGWTGGYVLLALLLAPYLRKFGKFTVPDFVGDRYYSDAARVVALICAIIVSLTYVAGQMRGVGVVFSRFLEVPVEIGVLIGMFIVFFYAGLGGMKGITYTQVAQYCVLICAFLIPAIAISMKITGTPIPQIGFGSEILSGPDAGVSLLAKLDEIGVALGFGGYTSPFANLNMLNVICITMALMVGTAGLPHVIIRFYTVPSVRAARLSAGYALLFIAILYTTAPAVAAFARYNMINTLGAVDYNAEEKVEVPGWVNNWARTGLIAWVDKNDDGKIQFLGAAAGGGEAIEGTPTTVEGMNKYNLPNISNASTDNANELYVDRDIMVLANPEIAGLPAWVIALVAAGGLAAALSTASGLLLVIASSISHDLYYRIINRQDSEKQRLLVGRIMIGVAVIAAGYFGINPPGFVAQVVALAFGLASSSFFPIILLGIFWKRANREGAIAGMCCGMGFTLLYIFTCTPVLGGTMDPWFLGIKTTGIGTIGMLINFIVTVVVSLMTPAPPQEIQDMVESVRIPRGAGAAVDH